MLLTRTRRDVVVLAAATVLCGVSCAGRQPPDGEQAASTPTTAAARGQGPAAPGRVPPNASRVTADVRARDVWPPGSLAGEEPPVDPEETFYSLTLEILTSARAEPDLDDLARPGAEVTAFTTEVLGADLVGRTITAVLRLEGTTQSVRWFIEDVEIGSGSRPR